MNSAESVSCNVRAPQLVYLSGDCISCTDHSKWAAQLWNTVEYFIFVRH